MKAAGASLGVLRKLEKKTGPEAVANAEKLGGIYENMIGFWRQRNAEDAVKLSDRRQGRRRGTGERRQCR